MSEEKMSGDEREEGTETEQRNSSEGVEKAAQVRASSSGAARSARVRTVSLPLSRIKQIMKMDPQLHMASTESVYLIAKSAEAFIKMLSKEALTYTQSSKKKTIQKRDVDSAINNSEQLCFLDGALD